MKFYLSSYKFGDEVEKLVASAPYGKIGFVPNALDFSAADLERKRKSIAEQIETLSSFGLETELIDLQEYFGKQSELEEKINTLGAVFACGGNTFVLRQAMRLSGLDQILENLRGDNKFLYAGYSAGVCVLAPDLRPYSVVDDSTDTPYEEIKEVIFSGLGFIEYAVMPHWNSGHPESEAIEDAIELCKRGNIPYRALRDGEVILIDSD